MLRRLLERLFRRKKLAWAPVRNRIETDPYLDNLLRQAETQPQKVTTHRVFPCNCLLALSDNETLQCEHGTEVFARLEKNSNGLILWHISYYNTSGRVAKLD